MKKIIKKSWLLITLILLVSLLSSCNTTEMTISPMSYRSEINKINSEISSMETYQLSGSGHEVKVTGQSYSRYGYGTLMDNDVSEYDNYTYTDSIGNTIEYQIKHKNSIDYYSKEYISHIEVLKCTCGDIKLYPIVCGKNGTVKRIENIVPNQPSTFYDREKSTMAISVVTIAGSLLLLTLIGL